MVAWKGDEVTINHHVCVVTHITVHCVHHRSGKSWSLVGVYGPQADADKLTFLNDLRLLYASSSLPSVCVGDLNKISFVVDKSNTRINRRMLNSFRRFINDISFKDTRVSARKDLYLVK